MTYKFKARQEITLDAHVGGISMSATDNAGNISDIHFEWDRIPKLIECLTASEKQWMEKPAIRREWWVFSTALIQGWLMVRCELTGATGSVRDASQEEWAAAYFASEENYRWNDESRVYLDMVEDEE